MKKQLLYIIMIFFIASVSPLFAQERPDALQKYKNGEYEEAVKICLNEIEQMPRNMDSYTVLGWSLIKLKKYQEALDYSLAALKISRYDSRIIENCGEAHYYLGNNLEALKYFEEYVSLVQSGGRIDVVYYYMGEKFIQIGEYHHADIALTTALYHSPNIARWWARLGYSREMAEDYRWSLEAYDKALKLNPSNPESVRGKNRVQMKLAG
ncbi:MAG: tetratricopeptide repeat protein [Spirochaetia bacterium]|jgi:tetratricopeptide (TPR) repeat protein|nr:tetratricopeptide repeat protein [Spirochaetia bacterium]